MHPINQNYFRFLMEEYSNRKTPKESFISQIKSVECCIGIQSNSNNSKAMIAAVENKFKCDNDGLVATIRFLFYLMSQTSIYSELFELLNQVKLSIYVQFYQSENNNIL